MPVAQPRGRAGRVGPLQVEDGHAGPLGGHLARRGKTESVDPCAAGDDGDPVLEQHVPVSAVVVVDAAILGRHEHEDKRCFISLR